MKLEEVRACLEGDGWPVDVVSDVNMRSRFRCGERVFPLFVHLEPGDDGGHPHAPGCVTFAVIPFARLPIDEAGDFMALRLLTLNREMNMAKFSVDEDGDVVLSVEYPLPDLDPSEVRDAVDVLSFYAEKYRVEVQAMAAAGAPDPTRPPA
jgi:Putative bacterial sensory transduction regulator